MNTHRLQTLTRWVSHNWNAVLAGASLGFVAVFSFVPNGEEFLPFFYFAAANAVVWTLVEIKSLIKTQDDPIHEFASMRSARGEILEDLRRGARKSRPDRPLRAFLIGGRIRSMSDIMLEIADELSSGRTIGYVDVQLSCIEPGYLTGRVLPGDVSAVDQQGRNLQVADGIRSTIRDLDNRCNFTKGISSMQTTVVNYPSDPTHYAVLIEGVAVYWGPYTWSESKSDWVGPENGCVRYDRTSVGYESLRDWVENRSTFYEAQQFAEMES